MTSPPLVSGADPADIGIAAFRAPAASGRGAAPEAAHIKYRPDIDGLRAVAVLSVLGYHVGFSWLSGGFVGVDVFFVISGYLISANILGEVRARNFSIARFYVRRIRRIAPALVAMMLAVFVLAFFDLFPKDFKDFAESALSAALSVSNIYFLTHTGYFDAPSSTKPLLHTWSLAVEEQFYVFFPLYVMFVVKRAPKLLNPTIALLWAGSFAWSAYGAFADPDATFYLAHTRAWELLVGTIIANQSWGARLGGLTRNVLGAVGIGLIAFAVLTYTFETPFPGATALAPCLGAGLIILAGQSGRSFVGRMLSLKPVVFVGLISYSLYLWHWPIIVFQDSNALVVSGVSPLLTHIAIVIVAFLVATASWWFIERPFRIYGRSAPSARVFMTGLAALGGVAGLALAIILADGMRFRFSPKAVEYAGYLDYGQSHFREGKCFIVKPYKFSDFDDGECLTQVAGEKNYLLVGDSLAAHLWYGLSKADPGAHVLQATAAGCRPAFTLPFGASATCGRLMTYALKDYLTRHPVDKLLISGHWIDLDLPGLDGLLQWAKDRGIPVVLFGPSVEYDLALPRLLAESVEKEDPQLPARHLLDRTALDGRLAAMAAKYGDAYVSWYKLLCPDDRCVTLAPDGTPLEFDADHFTRPGAVFAAQRLLQTGLLR